MLDRPKLLAALQAVSHSLFADNSTEYNVAHDTWDTLIHDPQLQEKCALANTGWCLPTWIDDIKKITPVMPLNKPYQIIAVDGSQIYPDKHQGTQCFLINIGTITLSYNLPIKGIAVSSEPTIFTNQTNQWDREAIQTVDMVNCKREELELKAGLELLKQSPLPITQKLFLFDGSLIFWHLESKEFSLKDYFIKTYCSLLEQLEKEQFLCAGYISLPKSKDLVNIARAFLMNFKSPSQHTKHLPQTTDSVIMSNFLPHATRSAIFKSSSPITALYPPQVAPYFFYMNVGIEIVRVEVPAYIAHNATAIHTICSMLLDQAHKGFGFPVALAEAHEQAVVKGIDRDFFYHVIEKLSIEEKRQLIPSQKSRKKRGMAV